MKQIHRAHGEIFMGMKMKSNPILKLLKIYCELGDNQDPDCVRHAKWLADHINPQSYKNATQMFNDLLSDLKDKTPYILPKEHSANNRYMHYEGICEKTNRYIDSCYPEPKDFR